MKEKVRLERLHAALDDKFLDHLVEVAKLYGWDGDYTEIAAFIEDLYESINKTSPDLDPYEIENE